MLCVQNVHFPENVVILLFSYSCPDQHAYFNSVQFHYKQNTDKKGKFNAHCLLITWFFSVHFTPLGIVHLQRGGERVTKMGNYRQGKGLDTMQMSTSLTMINRPISFRTACALNTNFCQTAETESQCSIGSNYRQLFCWTLQYQSTLRHSRVSPARSKDQANLGHATRLLCELGHRGRVMPYADKEKGRAPEQVIFGHPLWTIPQFVM